MGLLKNNLTPVSLTGLIVPWSKRVGRTGTSDYKLVCSSGLEYFIITDHEWREVLANHSWDQVTVIGKLNLTDMSVLPEKILPKGPNEKRGDVIDLAARKGRPFVQKLVKNLNDLVLVPAVICAMIMSTAGY